MRRHPTGGWTLNVRHDHVGTPHRCDTLMEAADLIARDTNVTHVHLWSGARGGFMDVELQSLAPLLEESRRRAAC